MLYKVIIYGVPSFILASILIADNLFGDLIRAETVKDKIKYANKIFGIVWTDAVLILIFILELHIPIGD